MSAKLAVVGAVTAGLFAVGGVAFAVAFQPVPVREVQLIQPAVAPTSAPTTAAPVVKAPVAVRSVQAPVRVAVKPKVVVVPKAVAPAVADPVPSPAGTYQDGTPVKLDAGGNVILLPPKPVIVPDNKGK